MVSNFQWDLVAWLSAFFLLSYAIIVTVCAVYVEVVLEVEPALRGLVHVGIISLFAYISVQPNLQKRSDFRRSHRRDLYARESQFDQNESEFLPSHGNEFNRDQSLSENDGRPLSQVRTRDGQSTGIAMGGFGMIFLSMWPLAMYTNASPSNANLPDLSDDLIYSGKFPDEEPTSLGFSMGRFASLVCFSSGIGVLCTLVSRENGRIMSRSFLALMLFTAGCSISMAESSKHYSDVRDALAILDTTAFVFHRAFCATRLFAYGFGSSDVYSSQPPARGFRSSDEYDPSQVASSTVQLLSDRELNMRMSKRSAHRIFYSFIAMNVGISWICCSVYSGNYAVLIAGLLCLISGALEVGEIRKKLSSVSSFSVFVDCSNRRHAVPTQPSTGGIGIDRRDDLSDAEVQKSSQDQRHGADNSTPKRLPRTINEEIPGNPGPSCRDRSTLDRSTFDRSNPDDPSDESAPERVSCAFHYTGYYICVVCFGYYAISLFIDGVLVRSSQGFNECLTRGVHVAAIWAAMLAFFPQLLMADEHLRYVTETKSALSLDADELVQANERVYRLERISSNASEPHRKLEHCSKQQRSQHPLQSSENVPEGPATGSSSSKSTIEKLNGQATGACTIGSQTIDQAASCVSKGTTTIDIRSGKDRCRSFEKHYMSSTGEHEIIISNCKIPKIQVDPIFRHVPQFGKINNRLVKGIVVAMSTLDVFMCLTQLVVDIVLLLRMLGAIVQALSFANLRKVVTRKRRLPANEFGVTTGNSSRKCNHMEQGHSGTWLARTPPAITESLVMNGESKALKSESNKTESANASNGSCDTWYEMNGNVSNGEPCKACVMAFVFYALTHFWYSVENDTKKSFPAFSGDGSQKTAVAVDPREVQLSKVFHFQLVTCGFAIGHIFYRTSRVGSIVWVPISVGICSSMTLIFLFCEMTSILACVATNYSSNPQQSGIYQHDEFINMGTSHSWIFLSSVFLFICVLRNSSSDHTQKFAYYLDL